MHGNRHPNHNLSPEPCSVPPSLPPTITCLLNSIYLPGNPLSLTLPCLTWSHYHGLLQGVFHSLLAEFPDFPFVFFHKTPVSTLPGSVSYAGNSILVNQNPAPVMSRIADRQVIARLYQPWDFFGRNDAKAETPVLWPPHAKS